MEIITVALKWIEQHSLLTILAAIVAANLLVGAAMLLYVRIKGLPECAFKRKLHDILFLIDEECDHLDNQSKKSLAVMQIQQVMAWKRVFLPTAVIGWFVAAEVYYIRKMQEITGMPNLHHEDEPEKPAVQNDNPGEGA